MPTLVDLTQPSLNILPVPQSSDVKICTLTLPTVAVGDKFAMSIRETFQGTAVGTLAKAGRFEVNIPQSKVTIWLNEKTADWYAGKTIKEEDRVRVLTGTLLHENAAGLSYVWSGEMDIRFKMSLGYTRA